ncbi:MAG: VWA domain-containing protein [Trueperaceae bacterium]|nr:VWA domain-containing protein [Trueperaceae bacterium]
MLTFAAPAFLWALLALGAVVLLHRVRARRPRREVAGLFLWRRAREAGARRPRFRTGLLLVLQLLAVTALALALARPLWGTTGPGAVVVVLDGSASMRARDGAGAPAAAAFPDLAPGTTRVEVARRVAEAVSAEAGRVALVRAGRTARVLLPPSEDPEAIAAALASFRAGDANSDAERALVLARDLAARGGAAGAPAPIHWIGDAPPPASAGVRVHAVAGRGENVGITGFERVAQQAWVRLSSTAARPLEVPLRVLRGDTEVARSTVVVPARGDTSLTFPVGGGGGAIEARITPPAGDALALDDVAFAGAPEVRVALERDFGALLRALDAIDDVRTTIGPVARTGTFDLRFLVDDTPAGDGDAAESGGDDGGASSLPGGAVVVFPPRDADAVAAEVTDWDAADPALRFVDLSELVVALAWPPPLEETSEGTTLVHGVPQLDRAPGGRGEGAAEDPGAAREDAEAPQAAVLLRRIARPAGPVWRFAFHPVRGDLTLRPAFPTLVANLVDQVREGARVPLGARLPAGATRDGDPVEVADRPGLYRVEGRTVHASLRSEEETRLPGPDAFKPDASAGASQDALQDEGGSAPPAGEGAASRPLWSLLAGAALLLLVGEWWAFSGMGPAWPPWRRRSG